MKRHDYHILPPSPYPILVSLALFLLAAGSVAFFHDHSYAWMLPGFVAVILLVILWLKSIAKESWLHTPVVTLHMRYAFVLFILSELMFFVAWFWSYFDIAINPAYTGLPERFALFSGVFPAKRFGDGSSLGDPLYQYLASSFIGKRR